MVRFFDWAKPKVLTLQSTASSLVTKAISATPFFSGLLYRGAQAGFQYAYDSARAYGPELIAPFKRKENYLNAIRSPITLSMGSLLVYELAKSTLHTFDATSGSYYFEPTLDLFFAASVASMYQMMSARHQEPVVKWAKPKVLMIEDGAKKTYQQTHKALSFIYHSPAVRAVVNSYYDQIRAGLLTPFSYDAHTRLQDSPSTWELYLYSMRTNFVLCGGSVLVYEFSRYLISSVDGSYGLLTSSFDFLAAFWFMQLLSIVQVRNNIFNSLISKTAWDENINLVYEKNCACGSIPIVQANLASPFYFISSLAAADFMGSYFPFAAIFIWLFKTQVFGQSLVEYLLGRLCTIHRYDVISRNNAFAFGLGLAFMLTVEILCGAFRLLTGIDNYFTRTAITAMAYQHFIFLTYLIDKPLPGIEKGLDLFFHGRLVMESLLKSGANIIMTGLQNPDPTIDFKKILQIVLDFPLIKAARYLFLPRDYQNVDTFVKTKEVQLFFDIRGDNIQETLEWFIDVRNRPLNQRVNYVMQKLPNYLTQQVISPETKGAMKVIFEKKLDGVLEYINNFITDARLKIVIHDNNALKLVSLDDSLVPQQAPVEEAPRVQELKAEDFEEIKIDDKKPEAKTDNIDGDFVLVEKEEKQQALVVVQKQNQGAAKNNSKEATNSWLRMVPKSDGLQENSMFKKDSKLREEQSQSKSQPKSQSLFRPQLSRVNNNV